MPEQIHRIAAVQVGDDRVEYLTEPSLLEVRMAALQAAATVHSGDFGTGATEAVVAMTREFERLLLETPGD